MNANKPENRFLLVSVVLGVLCGATGCDKAETLGDEGAERQTCLGSELAPIDALTACSRFIAAANGRSLSRSDAYYNRGVAFSDLGELHHAQIDLEAAIKLDPRNQWARQRLEAVNEALSKGGV